MDRGHLDRSPERGWGFFVPGTDRRHLWCDLAGGKTLFRKILRNRLLWVVFWWKHHSLYACLWSIRHERKRLWDFDRDGTTWERDPDIRCQISEHRWYPRIRRPRTWSAIIHTCEKRRFSPDSDVPRCIRGMDVSERFGDVTRWHHHDLWWKPCRPGTGRSTFLWDHWRWR